MGISSLPPFSKLSLRQRSLNLFLANVTLTFSEFLSSITNEKLATTISICSNMAESREIRPPWILQLLMIVSSNLDVVGKMTRRSPLNTIGYPDAISDNDQRKDSKPWSQCKSLWTSLLPVLANSAKNKFSNSRELPRKVSSILLGMLEARNLFVLFTPKKLFPLCTKLRRRMLLTARDFFRGLSRNQISKRAKFEFLIGSSRKVVNLRPSDWLY